MKNNLIRILCFFCFLGPVQAEGVETGSKDKAEITPPKVTLTPYQTFAVTAARSIRYFQIDKVSYLALAQFAADSADSPKGPDGGDSDINSIIYRWDGKQFVQYQLIPSHGGRDWEYFNIGQDHYLALANLRAGKGPYQTNTNSVIYKWKENQFVPFQEIKTNAAQEWTPFKIDNEPFLAVANYAQTNDGKPNFDVDSFIYKWNGHEFESFQTIPTHAAFAWNYFNLNQENYLLVANAFSSTSEIYQWVKNQFKLFQQIPTNKARDSVQFNIGEQHFLAIANLGGNSDVYSWNGKEFVPFQELKGAGGRRVVFFEQDGNYFLVKINYLIDNNFKLKSQLYVWNGQQFVLGQEFETFGGTDASYFTIGNKHFLAVANGHKDNSTFKVDSIMYEVKVGP